MINFNSNDNTNNINNPVTKSDYSKQFEKLGFISSTTNKPYNPLSKFTHNHSINQQNNVINLSSYGSNSGSNNNLGQSNNNFNSSQGTNTQNKKGFNMSNTPSTNTNLSNLTSSNSNSNTTNVNTNNMNNFQQVVPTVKSSSNLYSMPKTTKASIKDSFKDKRQFEFTAFNKSEIPNFNMLSINTPTNNNIKSYTKSIQGSSTINKISMNKESNLSSVNSGRDGNNNAFVYTSANTNNNGVFTSSTTNKEKSQITNFGIGKNVPMSTTSKGGVKIDYLSTQKKQASIKRFGK